MKYRSILIMFKVINILVMSIVLVQSGKINHARIINNSLEKSSHDKNLLLNLRNESFTASSVWQNKTEFEPHQARMTGMAETNPSLFGQAWCTNGLIKDFPEEWIEIDLGDLKLIRYLFTVGRGDGNFEEFAPFFYFDYQRAVEKWYRYQKKDSEDQLLDGNNDARNVARIQFPSPVVARKIRIYPIGKNKPIRACMRIGIYGSDFDDGVVEYSVNQGHIYVQDKNHKYDLRDLTYDGTELSDNKTSSLWIEKGLGQLMDNIIYHDTIFADNSEKVRGYHFVGWNRKLMPSNKVEIIFKFDQTRIVKQIRLYALNMIPKEIGIFASAIVHFSSGGVIYDKITQPQHFKTVTDKRVYHSRWIELKFNDILTRYIKMDLIFDVDWIVLSEIVIISEKSNLNLPVEIDTIRVTSSTTKKSSTKQEIINDITSIPIGVNKKPQMVETNKPSFVSHSNLGLIATISSCFLGIIFLLALIVFGVFTLRRHNKRTKGKLRHPIYQSRINGGPFIGDSVVVPLTGGTHSSSGTGSIYYKHPGSVELGLTYPIMGKEYMTLSSKSGTDYDMAGGNSLDGLIPTASRDNKYNSLGQHSTHLGHSESPYPNNIYSRNSVDGSTGGSSNTDYASASLYHFSQVFDNGSNFYTYNQQGLGMNSFALQKLNPSVMSSLSGSPFKVQSPTPSTQILPTNQMMDMIPQYSPYRQLPHFNHFSPTHSASSRFLMPSNADLYPTAFMMSQNNFTIDRPNVMPISRPHLQGMSGNSVMILSSDVCHQEESPKISLKNVLSMLKEFHQEQIEHVSVIGKGENGTIGFINISQSPSVEDTNKTIRSRTYMYRSLNHYKPKEVRHETVQEMEILCSIKNSVFLPLTAYVLDQQNSTSIKQWTLCFLFEIDENSENLHSFLQQHAMNKAAVLNLPRGPTLYSQSISNISTNPSFDTRQLYPSISSLIFIVTQVAKGMSYLESQKIIHRDLAARNCLVNRNLIIKITDIAVSIQKFKEHYTECPVIDIQKSVNNSTSPTVSIIKRLYPLQWMSFETILQATYSVKTDVWSFGVLMWEILNRCQQIPYGSFSINFDRMRDNAYLMSIGSPMAMFPSGILYPHQSQSTFRSSQNMINYPSSILDGNLGLSRDFSDLIRECWNKIPLQRPSFKNIHSFLEQKINSYEFSVDQPPFLNNCNNETY